MRHVVICILTAMLSVALARTAHAEPKRVLVLHSYGQNFKPWRDYAVALRQEFERQSRWPIDVQDFSVVTARFDDKSVETQFVEYLGALFAHGAPDLIVAIGAPAALFVQQHRAGLFPSVPMVLTAVEERRVRQSALTDNDAVVAVKQDLPALFANILRLRPETKTVAVVIGDSPNERFWLSEFRREIEPTLSNVKMVFWNDKSFPDILKQAATLPPNSAIFWVQLQVDGTGAVHEGERALKHIHDVANAPIFSYDESFFGGETVGGPMTSAAKSGHKTAEVALRILGGEKPDDIKTPTLEYGPPRYDWRQLQRWNIPESRLPPDSEVEFRPPTAWAPYRWQISLIAAVILLQAALISILVHERRRRLLAEVQARQRSAELAHINRFTMAGELTASIAHELNQPLGAILTNAESAALMLKSDTPDLKELREIVEDIRRDDSRASEVIIRLRSLLKKAPFEQRDLDLNQVARETIEFLQPLATARDVELDPGIAAGALPIRGDRVQLQQVIMNLIVNAIDAISGAAGPKRRIGLRTARVGEFAEIGVCDNGPGILLDRFDKVFEPFFTTKPQGMGMGLAIARTIVEAHHGRIAAENKAEGGAVFRIILPLAAPGRGRS
ncbi:sensor histidine kinase [Bradyrhizobium manausense]|uniref:sensor histidine kinase n=1 Tax=Bradyrhizobium TaxID=374 RepID=UPI001BA8DE10|nr:MULTISPECIES: ATP-binding protein [Bradyrhizobium]MBR0831395.1 sensor histidine kinase [Bradyrhizobium manausense]UVO27789.1 sensor histidine kinase [Bradyrhizobium arachidis]